MAHGDGTTSTCMDATGGKATSAGTQSRRRMGSEPEGYEPSGSFSATSGAATSGAATSGAGPLLPGPLLPGPLLPGPLRGRCFRGRCFRSRASGAATSGAAASGAATSGAAASGTAGAASGVTSAGAEAAFCAWSLASRDSFRVPRFRRRIFCRRISRLPDSWTPAFSSLSARIFSLTAPVLVSTATLASFGIVNGNTYHIAGEIRSGGDRREFRTGTAVPAPPYRSSSQPPHRRLMA